MSSKNISGIKSLVLGKSLGLRGHKRQGMKLAITSFLIGSSLALTSCGGTPAALPDPEIKVYLLDLSTSGDVKNQFRLIEEDLTKDMTSESLGSPYEKKGPSLTKFYFVGTNSRALREFSLQDQQVVYDLFQYVGDENNNTRTEKFWRLLSEKYQNFMIEKLGEPQPVSKQQCLNYFDEVFLPTWNSDRVREVYSSFMCRMALYSLSNFVELQQYIESESQPGVQKASDVFGALSKIGSQVEKFQQEFKGSEIKITLATDGDHNLGANSPSNLRSRILSSSDVCALAEEYRREFELGSLIESKNLKIDPRGISALTNGTGEYPRQLESFWNCFFPTK
jgi:hypothetical protein